MARRPFSSLRFRLLVLVLLSVIPTLGLAVYTNVELRRLAAADVKREALGLARIAASDQGDSIRATRQLLFTISQLPEAHGGDPDACSAFFSRLRSQYPQYALLGVATRGGDLVCSAPPVDEAPNLAGRACFRRVLETSALAVGECLGELAGGGATLEFGYPVLGDEQVVQAVLFASLDLSWLNQLAAEAQLPGGSTLTVFGGDGTILVRYPDPEAWVGDQVPDVAIVRAILERRAEGTAEARGIDGTPRLFAFKPISGIGSESALYVSIGIPRAVAFADANRLLVRNLAGLGGVALLAFAAAWFGARLFVLGRLTALVQATRRLSDGNLGVRAGVPYDEGELGQLARAFDEMAQSLERMNQKLEERVADRTRELSVLYEDTQAASASLDLETVMERSLQRILTAMKCDVGMIHLLDREQGVLRLAVYQGVPSETTVRVDAVPVDAGLAGWVIERDGPLVVPDTADGPRPLRAVSLSGPHAYLGVPMHARGQTLGVLSIVGQRAREYSPEEVSLLSSIADQVGVAVENAQLYRQAEQLAVMRERQRMARELHDSVTQALYSLVLLGEASRRLAEGGDLRRVQEAIVRLGEIGQQALKEMRLLVYELRPLALKNEGLVRALQQRLDAVEKRAGVEASLTVEGAVSMPASVEEELYRIVQEALNNALKHAAASAVTVHIRSGDDSISVEVVDNGVGFEPEVASNKGGMGLVSIRERVEKLGGSLTIRSGLGEGTTVLVSVGACSAGSTSRAGC
jgi:signal transduction histidine kinase